MGGFEYLADGHLVDDAGNLIACPNVDFIRGPGSGRRFDHPASKTVPHRSDQGSAGLPHDYGGVMPGAEPG